MRQDLLDRLVRAAQEVASDANNHHAGEGEPVYDVGVEVIDNLKQVVKEISDDAYRSIQDLMKRDGRRRRLGVEAHDVLNYLEDSGIDWRKFEDQLLAARQAEEEQKEQGRATAEVMDKPWDERAALLKAAGADPEWAAERAVDEARARAVINPEGTE